MTLWTRGTMRLTGTPPKGEATPYFSMEQTELHPTPSWRKGQLIFTRMDSMPPMWKFQLSKDLSKFNVVSLFEWFYLFKGILLTAFDAIMFMKNVSSRPITEVKHLDLNQFPKKYWLMPVIITLSIIGWNAQGLSSYHPYIYYFSLWTVWSMKNCLSNPHSYRKVHSFSRPSSQNMICN